MGRAAIGLTLLALGQLAGCYVEGSASFYPAVSQKVFTPRDPAIPTSTDKIAQGDNSGWALGVILGFYLDIPIESAHTAIGFGATPFGAKTVGGGHVVDRTVNGVRGGRLDVMLPFRVLWSKLQTRATVGYSYHIGVNSRIAGEPEFSPQKSSSASTWFLGGSAGVSFGKALILLSLGADHYGAHMDNKDGRTVDVSAWGPGARLMIYLPPIGHPARAPFEDAYTGGGGGGGGSDEQPHTTCYDGPVDPNNGQSHIICK